MLRHPGSLADSASQKGPRPGSQHPDDSRLTPPANTAHSNFFELGRLPEPRYGIEPQHQPRHAIGMTARIEHKRTVGGLISEYRRFA